MKNISRDYNIDWLKNIAIYLVIILHLLCNGVNKNGFDISLTLYYTGVFAIPLLFMISGYLHLKKENDYNYVIKKILKILFICFTWNLIPFIYSLFIKHKYISIFYLIISSFSQEGTFWHFWFLGSLIILYLFLIPLQKLIKKYNVYKIITLLLLVTCITINIITIYSNFKGLGITKSKVTQSLRIWIWLLYYMIGGIMTKIDYKKINNKKRLYILTIIMIIITIVYELLFCNILYSSKFAENFYDSIIVMITSSLIFISFKTLIIDKKHYSTYLQYNMGIYIIHIFIINFLTPLHLFNNNYINIFWSIIILLISISITHILSKTPFLNKIIKI
ncbi:MAG: acyltransferase family protein [Bacilli bacterium]|nr:acyltransferase family protein [Bacilli bacterium]